ncbi:YcxB family protein [Blastopirellula marina]|uniref:YcxB-like C-terminal domain-containing protein n=1 Tax=Blastopirellula marina TaxID=124 RepID=A0A2S8G6S1_9BACT|nr:YcxB family protein [Blastopirellula marina]PQO40158.1 hypothetical protein C5Y98_06015 [Blastopirellula marina]PTL45525.1 hypothetical protein C5Y97_06015 [Blastopirellula marina]
MEVEFYYSPLLMKIWRQAHPLYRQLWPACAAPCWTAVAALPAAALLALVQQWACLLLLLAACAIWLGWVIAKRLRDLAALAVGPEIQEEENRIVVRLTPDYVETRAKFGVSRRSWATIRRIVRTADGMFLFFDRYSGRVVPNWAMSSEEAEQFYQLATEYHAAAATRQPLDLSIGNDDLIHDRCAGPGQTVRYQNQAIDWALSEIYGMQPPIAHIRNSNFQFALFGVFTCLLLTIYFVNELRVVGEPTLAVYFIYLGAAGFTWGTYVLLRHLRTLLAARQVPPDRLARQAATLHEDVLVIRSPYSFVANQWEVLPLGVFDADAYRVYDMGGNLQAVIPTAAFAASEEATQFFERMFDSITRANDPKTAAGIDAVDNGEAAEDPNPFRSPHT